MSALLAGLCALLAAAAVWELIGERGEALGRSLRRRAVARLARRGFGGGGAVIESTERRIVAAAMEDRLSPAAVLGAKLASSAFSLPLALSVAPAAPGRLGPLVLVGVPVAVFFGPDLLLERVARRRRTRVASALPDALDLMATGAATGSGAGALLGEAVRGSRGPLREELARAVAEIECGSSQEQALRQLRRRARGGSLSALAAALERSRRHGAPLARALHEQAGALRVDQRRAIAEQAARAAPKMQLVVALLLVPSVLLIVAAALVANSGSLLPSF